MDDFQFLIYRSAEEGATVKAVIKDDTIWLTISQMSLLFDKEESNLRRHIKNIFDDGELSAENSVQKMHVDGVKQPVAFYNLDVIISVGYRVNSRRATHFRIWATGILKEYMTKGFVLDDERLKQGKDAFGKDYFRELLERVRSIRASERRIWQQVTDIFAEHMGLSTWKNAPEGRVLKSDVSIAKNYLSEKQIRQLERTVSGYFDYIEDLIERENSFTMEQFAASINEFLSFRRYDILPDKGKISARQAKEKAEAEYDLFNPTQKIVSDFDKVLKQLAP